MSKYSRHSRTRSRDRPDRSRSREARRRSRSRRVSVSSPPPLARNRTEDNCFSHSDQKWKQWNQDEPWRKEDQWTRASSSSWEIASHQGASWSSVQAFPPAPPVLPVLPAFPAFPRRSPPSKDSWAKEGDQSSTQVPESFQSDVMYIDKSLVFGLPLPRQIIATDWTQKKGIAGQEVQEVRLVDVIYGGLSNWVLRHLGMGKATYFVLAKTYDKSTVLYALNAALRDASMEVLAMKWNESMTKPLPVTTEVEKKELLSKYGEHVAKMMSDGAQDSNLYERVQELERDNVELKMKLAETGKKGSNVHGLGKFSRKGSVQFLQSNCPAVASAKEVGTWISKQLSKTQSKNIPKALSELKEVAQNNIPEEAARVEALKLGLIDHGMPVAVAAKMDKDLCYKMIVALHLRERD